MEHFIAHVHEQVRQARLTRRGATVAPENAKRGLYKSYPRMEQFPLSEPELLNTTLSEVLQKRKSYEGGTESSAISNNDWGTLLGLSLRKRSGSTSRNYPSGGGLYPVETYIVGNVLESQPKAVFHYEPAAHSLEKLWDLPTDLDLKEFDRMPKDLFFSAFIIFTSVWKRSAAKYGDLAYSHGLLEAGHMSENILLTATALGLLSRPIAGFNDELIIRQLDLEPRDEQAVHGIALSRPSII
jgi:SagB-type dehydrogenase family enzyme